MNIQINAKEDITENELRYIYHNLKDIIQLYKDSFEYNWKKKYPYSSPIVWRFELGGCGVLGKVGRKVFVKGVNNTLYFKFK